MSTRLRWRAPGELDAAERQAWTELGLQAGPHPNPFAMPQFVLPALRWLTPAQPPRLAWIERRGRASRQLLAVGAFQSRGPNLFVPLPHLCDYRTLHTPRSGLLVAPGEIATAMTALLDALRAQSRWRALDLRNLPDRDGQLQTARQLALAQGGGWFPRRSFARPVRGIHAGDGATAQVESKERRRRRRRLAEQGALSFHLLQGAQADAQALEQHLHLEHAGWKGERGSSLLSSPAQAAFFRDMIAGFAALGLAAFMETRLDGKAIASSSNLRLGDTLNGLKIGWDPAYAAFSPGRLNETELQRRLPQELPQPGFYDSQSQERSYLADLLPRRMPVETGTLALGRRAALAMRAARGWRPLAWRLRDDD